MSQATARTCVGTYRGNGKRFVVRADERITYVVDVAFVLVRFDHVACVIVNADHSVM